MRRRISAMRMLSSILPDSTSMVSARQAARWFGLSAHKGNCEAQAMLGAMLFAGDHVPRQAARGLMWLALAKDNARGNQSWIGGLYESAMRQATEDERAMAGVYLKRWLEARHD